MSKDENLVQESRLPTVMIKDKEDEMNQQFNPPDGGKRAWLVMISSFLVNGIIFGTINTFGVFYVFFKEEFKDDPNVSSKVALIGSIAIGATFLCSPISGILVDRIGIQKTALLGSIMACVGMTLSGLVVHKLEYLYFTYLIYGIGASTIYTPSLVILGHYFKKHIGVVNGVVTAGSSIFTLVMPHILHVLIKSLGLRGSFFVLSGITSLLIIAACLFKPLIPKPSNGDAPSVFNTDIWKNTKYVVWCLGISSALFGYFVPYVHIVQYVKDIDPNLDGSVLITCIGLTSGVGRIIFGKLSDCQGTNRIFLQQISFIAIGSCTMLLTVAPEFSTPYIFPGLIIFALIMGLFDGCFISVLGPIAFDICGPDGASQAIGFVLGFCSIPLTAGPPIAGIIYDSFSNDYTVPFIVAGIPPILGACLMFAIKCVGNETKSDVLHPKHSETQTTLLVSNEINDFDKKIIDEKLPTKSFIGNSHNSTSETPLLGNSREDPDVKCI